MVFSKGKDSYYNLEQTWVVSVKEDLKKMGIPSMKWY